MTEREKALAAFANDILDTLSQSGGLDIEYSEITEMATRHGLIVWHTANEDNQDEWPSADFYVNEGDPFWTASLLMSGKQP